MWSAVAIGAGLVVGGGFALALWVHSLYMRGERVPELMAALKVLLEERNALTRDLAVARDDATRAQDAAAAFRKQLSSSLGTQRRETDAQIQERPDDAAAQQRIADQLLERPWPGDDPAGS